MRHALSRRPVALLAAVALVAPALAVGLMASPASAAGLTITNITNPVNLTNQATVDVAGVSVPGDAITITATDGVAALPATSAATAGPDGTFDNGSRLDVSRLADGVLTVTVRSSQQNTSVSQAITKDTVGPTAPGAVTLSPSTPVNKGSQGAVTVSASVGLDANTVRITIGDGTTTLTAFPSGPSPYSSTFDVTSLKDGTLTGTVTAIDVNGNEASTAKTVTKDATSPSTPTVVVTGTDPTSKAVTFSKPGPPNGVVTLTGATSEASTYVATVSDSGTTKTFTPATESTDKKSYTITFDPYLFADGPLNVSVVAVDLAGNPSNSGTATVAKDTSVPAVAGLTINPNPINAAKQDSVIVSGTVLKTSGSASPSESGTKVLLHLAGTLAAPGAPVVSGPADQTVTAGPDGSFSASFVTSSFTDTTVTASATPTDPAQNTGSVATTTAGKDTVAPGKPTVSTVGPAQPANLTAVPISGQAEAGSTVTFTVTDGSTHKAAGSAVANGSGAFSGTFDATGLDDGVITATALATDAAGNVSSLSDPKPGNKDTISFALVSTSPVDNGATSPNGTVSATYNEPLSLTLSSITVKTPAPGNVPVSGNTSYSADGRTISFKPTAAFPTGSYVATIVGKESGVGNDPAITTTLTFAVDASTPDAPVLTGITNPIGKSTQTAVHVTGTAPVGSSVVITIEDGAVDLLMRPAPNTASSQPTTVGASGAFDAIVNVTGLLDGSVTATGVATNLVSGASSAKSAAITATKDTVAPTVTGTAATDTTQASPSTTVTATASESGLAVTVTLTDRAGGTISGSGTSGAGGAIRVVASASSLLDGPVAVTIVVRDAAANASDPAAASAKATFTKDATGPTVAGLTASKVNIASNGKITVSGSTGEPGSVTVTVTDKNNKSVAAAPGVGSTGGFTTGNLDVSGLADGPVTVTAVGKDSKGNGGPTATTSSSKDTIKPVVTNLAATATNSTNNSTTVTGNTDAGAPVAITVSDGTRSVRAAATASSSGAFTATLDLTGFNSGALPVTAVATDTSGNTGDPASTTAQRNAAAPAITNLSATPTTVAKPASTVTGKVSDAKASVAVTAKDVAGATKSSNATVGSDGSFTATVDLTGLADGTVTVTAVATDLAGNKSAPANTTTTKDATTPKITNLAATDVTTSAPSTTVTGKVDDTKASVGLTATDKNGAKVNGAATVAASGSFSGALNLSSLADGTITVTAVATDLATNVGPTAATTAGKNVVGPKVTNLAATASTAGTPSSTVTGTVTGSATSVSLLATDKNAKTVSGTATLAANGNFSGSLDLSTLADGDVTVKATATNSATGLTGFSTTTTTRSSTGAVPGTPAAPTATAGNAQATVSFSPPSSGGSPITGYTVTASPGGITKTGASSPITVTGLTNGTTYTFTVKATNSAGTGPASPPSNAVTPTGPTTGSTIVGLNGATGTIRYGTALALTGRVVRGDRSVPIGVISVLVRDDSGVVRTLFRVRPSSTGDYVARTLPSFNGTYTVRYDGDSANPVASSAGRRILVAVRITVSAPTGAASTPLVVTGSVAPNKAGRTLVLYRVLSNGALQAIARGNVASDGRYRISVRLARGNYTLQVGLGATPGNAAGATRFGASRS